MSKPTWSRPARLQAGERVRFEDGSTYRVDRVTECSATLVPELREPKEITVPVRNAHGQVIGTRTFQAHAGGARIQVSPFSFVERLT